MGGGELVEHEAWTAHQIGHPTRDRFGLTIDNGPGTIWLDQPDSPRRWVLSAPS